MIYFEFITLYLDERIVLRTLNYKHLVPRWKPFTTMNICYGTFEIISTDLSNTNNHYFQSHNNSIEFYMPTSIERRVNSSCTNIPFRNVDFLVICLSLIESGIISSLKNIFTSSE